MYFVSFFYFSFLVLLVNPLRIIVCNNCSFIERCESLNLFFGFDHV